MRSYKTEGFVLSRKNSGETDRLVTLFTRHFGKKQFIAKGIRRITSKRAPHLELFSHVSLVVHKGRTLDLILEAEAIDHFTFIRTRLERVGHVYVALELIQRLTAENQEQEYVYLLLKQFLETMCDPGLGRLQAKKELTTFKTKLLISLGFSDEAQVFSEAELDQLIEKTLESSLKSPALLTQIQRIQLQ